MCAMEKGRQMKAAFSLYQLPSEALTCMRDPAALLYYNGHCIDP